MRNRTSWIAAGLAVVMAGTFITTGISTAPTWVALGPCLKDLTSPVSYHARISPLGTVDAHAGAAAVRLCYGRPAMRGRTVYGGLVPFDSLWRMGANEPTRLSTSGPIRLAELTLPAGRYSLYTIPHSDRWEIFATRSTLHWGNDISPSIRAREVGSTTVPVEHLAQPVETLTIHVDTARGQAELRIDWETTRVTLPLRAAP